jgi:hypothetical protein
MKLDITGMHDTLAFVCGRGVVYSKKQLKAMIVNNNKHWHLFSLKVIIVVLPYRDLLIKLVFHIYFIIA